MSSPIEQFCDGLRKLGYTPMTYPTAPNHVTFDFSVPCGSLIGQAVQLGFAVPPDFPTAAPSGPHSTPALVADDGSGSVPRGGLHLNHDATFKALTDLDWQYWSRPFPNWSSPTEPVAAYMAFIKKLWSAL